MITPDKEERFILDVAETLEAVKRENRPPNEAEVTLLQQAQRKYSDLADPEQSGDSLESLNAQELQRDIRQALSRCTSGSDNAKAA